MPLRHLFHPRLLFALLWWCGCLFVMTAWVDAQERLVMFGGGPRPPEAMARFIEWAGGERARILVITWATAEPQVSFDALAKDMARFHPASVVMAPRSPLNANNKNELLSQLKSATGIFFTGGDQGRIMNVLKDESLLMALRERYRAGVVFSGTSAGTAIMSRQMITGEGDFTVIDEKKVETREGLGLLPEGIVVDQHFIKRQRENRLFGVVMRDYGTLGIGIDEGTALAITDSRYGEVMGTSQVMMIDARARPGALIIYLVKPGERFDLKKRIPQRSPLPKKLAGDRAA